MFVKMEKTTTNVCVCRHTCIYVCIYREVETDRDLPVVEGLQVEAECTRELISTVWKCV